jgi:hypothetical protein
MSDACDDNRGEGVVYRRWSNGSVQGLVVEELVKAWIVYERQAVITTQIPPKLKASKGLSVVFSRMSQLTVILLHEEMLCLTRATMFTIYYVP